MAVKNATKSKSVSKVKSSETILMQKAQLFADLQDEVSKIMELPLFKEHDSAKKELLSEIDSEFDPAENGSISVEQGTVTYSIKRATTEINLEGKKKIIDIIGMDTFIQLATFPSKALSMYLSAKDIEDIVTTNRTGARTLKLKK